MRNFKKVLLAGVAAAALLAAAPLWAEQSAPGTHPVQVIVTAHGLQHKPPAAVTQGDVLAYQENVRRPVLDWNAVQGRQAGLDLAILIQDSLSTTSLGPQLGDLRSFIATLPPGTQVAVAYARNGMAAMAQNFTTDREQAGKALRLPLGWAEAYSSPYLSVTDMVKRFPEDTNRREILLISDGIDLFRGLENTYPGTNPDLDQAIRTAQREGVVVHTLFASGVGWLHHNFFLISNGQSSLNYLADETGGQAYFEGFFTPVAFAPYLEQLNRVLDQQYVLTFSAQTARKASYQRFRVTTEVPGVQLTGPSRVYIRGAA